MRAAAKAASLLMLSLQTPPLPRLEAINARAMHDPCCAVAGDCRVGVPKRQRGAAILRFPGDVPAAQGGNGHFRGRAGHLRDARRVLQVRLTEGFSGRPFGRVKTIV